MHDIDRALFEMEQEAEGSYETVGEAFETFETFESEGTGEVHELNETLEMQLAGELLEVTNEEELDRFLGGLVKRAFSAAKSFANSSAGRAVGGILKSAAKQALPKLGQTLGDFVAPGVGGQIGSKLGSFVGSRLEVQLEGLSQEDREFEVARAFVRFANDAAQRAISSPPSIPPAHAAVRAATFAAQRNLPGLVPVIQRLTPPGAGQTGRRANSGRWVRRGQNIVLFNA